MNNISKKNIILIFVAILAVLSTAFAYITLANDPIGGTNNYLPEEFFVERDIGCAVQYSYGEHDFASEQYFTLLELAQYQDLLCCERDNMEGIFDIEDMGTTEGTKFKPTNSAVDAMFPEGTAYDKDTPVGTKVTITKDAYFAFGSGLYTGKTLVYYKQTGGGACGPKEAYILSELGTLSPHVGVHYEFETDGSGNPIKVDPDSGYFNMSDRFILGEDEFFFGVKKYVTATGSGDALTTGIGPSGSYEWVKVKRAWGEVSGIIESVSKYGIQYTWSEPISSDLYESGEETTPGGAGGIVPGNVVVHIEGEGYYKVKLRTGGSNLQIAWWTTEAGGGGGSNGGNALSKEAQAFEDYIYGVSGGTLKRKTATWIDDQGNTHTDSNAFDFDYNPSWVTGGEYDDITVRLEDDTNTVVIGPFAIDYYEAHAHITGRNYVQFAGITRMELYTDASDKPLEFGENKDWSFVWLEGERSKPGDLKYPKRNEKFYIRMKYIEGATKITDFKVYFKYMNAAGSYKTYEGTYQIQKWQRGYERHAISAWHAQRIEDDGTVVPLDPPVYEFDHWEYDYYFELVTKEDYLPGQKLAEGEYGARWYEFCEITRTININTGKISITKDLIDRDGNVINDSDPEKWFYFTVKVDGAINSGKSEWLQVQPGKTVESKVYYWVEGSDAPTFTVTEEKTNEYDIVSMHNLTEGTSSNSNTITGTLKKNDTVSVKAVNRHENSGKLSIYKTLKDKDKEQVKKLIGTEFEFKVTIKGTFIYNNERYTEDRPLVLTAKAKAEGDPWISDDIIWYGKNVPTYQVEEIQNVPGTKLVSITSATGKIANGLTMKVVAENELIRERGMIKVIKTLENADLYDEEEINKLVFSFQIKVDGYGLITMRLRPIREGNQFVWRGTIGYFSWYYGNNPNYTITEVDNPEGTYFVSASADIDGATTSGSSISGKLTADEEKKATVTNNIINRIDIPNYGKIKITKKIEDTTLKDKDYKFSVVVNGTFEYNGVKYENKSIQLATDGSAVVIENDEYDIDTTVVIHVPEDENSWESGTFKWYGNTNPTYKVEEQLQGENIKFSVTPPTGEITGSRDEASPKQIQVYAWNRDLSRAGELQIIKKVENSEYMTADYVKSLKFTFNMWVERYGDMEIVLANPVLENGEWIWRSDKYKFSWNEDQGSPKYKITEVANDNGPQFERAENSEGTLVANKLDEVEFKTTESTIYNKAEAKKGTLTVEKQSSDSSLQGEEFTFDITLTGAFWYEGKFYNQYTIENFVVPVGSSKETSEITWYGDAPEYSVTERNSEIAKNISIIHGSGTIEEGNGAVAIFENTVNRTGGYLQVTKLISDGVEFKDDEFTFEIRIAKAGEDLNSVTPKIIKIKANQTYRSEYIEWDVTEDAPSYSVREMELPEGVTLQGVTTSNGTVNGDVATGKLLPNRQVVNVTATNKYGGPGDDDDDEGTFKITKVIIADEKAVDTLNATFGMKYKVTGTFEMNGEVVIDSTRVVDITLTVDPATKQATYTSPVIKWWKGKAPTVTVEETSMPKGWQFVGISNNGNPVKSVKDEQLEITVTNRFDIIPVIDITLELAGDVWEDVPRDPNEKNTENSVPNGKFEDTEVGIDGVEVYIYDESGNLATIYADMDNTPVRQPIITSNGGHWDAPRIKLTENFEKYNVVFVYDGQTYEPTTFLATSKGDASAYKGASTSGRDAYANDSMALDINRAEVNNRMAIISGDTVIDGYGNTTGTATGVNGEKNNLYYEEGKALSNSSRKVSVLKTTNSVGTAYDIFKTQAGTAIAGLTYPFDNKTHLENFDTKLTELGLEQTYYYSATYNYCLHINLGLVRRDEADLGATKDLYEAKVVVNEKLENYRFNKLADIGADCYSRQFYSDTNEIEYQLGLYSTDYFYRAEMYQSDYRVYDKIETMYKDINALKETELEVFLTYKLTLYNESQTYDVTINSVEDYFDSTFGKPIDTDVYRTIVDKDGNRSSVKVAEGSYYNNTPVSWTVTEKGIKSSDGVTYNKMATNFENLKLVSGESVDIYVTFRVEKDDFNGVHDSLTLGDKANIVEIASYSTFNKDGSIAGKVDRDSAPANVNIRDYNTKDWYEDDTDSSPLLNITLEEDTRSIVGLAWEDEDVDNNRRSKGVYDEGEALIGGLTVELVEKVEVDGIEYDFLWPTYKQLDCLGGRTLEELTGFDSTTETGRTGEDIGRYSFAGIPIGKYAVRFLYGNNKTTLEDTFGITGDAVALNSDGTNYSGTSEILTANYDGDNLGMTPAVYNGHDYKSAIYQKGFQTVDGNGYLTNKYHDLENSALADARVSDARDSESRRLEIISKTETMMNTTGTVLATANDITADHKELYNDYYMFADTAILDLTELEAKQYAGIKRVVSTTSSDSQGGVVVDVVNTDYKAFNIDFALVERPETEVVLDKQISEIKLTTSDNKLVFFADYDINYEVVKENDIPDDKTVIAKVKDGYLVAEMKLKDTSIGTNLLQAIDKVEVKLTDSENEGTQNFRFISVDDTILQGATIEIEYLFTALNIGEADYTSETLAKIDDYTIEGYNVAGKAKDPTVREKIIYLAKQKEEVEVKADEQPKLGMYLGSFYYTGDSSKDSVVTTRVRQLVDYVDNDAVFTSDMNTADDHSWRNTTITELQGNGYKANILVGRDVIPEYTVVDKNGMEYITNTKNNVVLSTDSSRDYEDGPNKGFEAKLVPYEVDEENYKSQIELTISKTVAAQDDADNLAFDNLAEIVKIENSVGRRDVAVVPGNANPKIGEFVASMNERDASATELVTFTPPTGIETQAVLTVEILIMTLIGLAVIVVGIVIIKKKVL